MKILLINKFYYPRGGDCIYTLELEKLLKAKGHEVAIFAMMHTQNLDSKFTKYFPSEIDFKNKNFSNIIKSFIRPIYSYEVKNNFNKLLLDFNPDVVHLNNIHSQLSPIIAKIAHKKGIKVIWTVHDYKMLCPRYDCLLKDSKSCELCYTNKIYVLKNKCIKNNIFASIIAFIEAIKWNKNNLQNYTDSFICPSQFIKDKMIKGGFKTDKLITLCNFMDVEKTKKVNYEKGDYFCFIGRLSLEKGVKTLIEATSTLPFNLKIIGKGPLFDDLHNMINNDRIEFLGFKNWPDIKEIVGKARFFVIPSECYENNPLSVIESQCLGTPILGANCGGIPELIEEGISGLLFESKNVEDLKTKIEEMFQLKVDYKQLAESSQNRFSSENYYTELMKIYTPNP